MSIWSALVYRVYALNNLGAAISLILATASFIIIIFIELKINKKSLETKIDDKEPGLLKNNSNRFINLLISVLYLTAIGTCFFFLFKNQTVGSIISPWEVVSYKFFAFYFLAILLLIYQIRKGQCFSLILISIHCLLSFLVATIIFKLGFGYDVFIHDATLKLIDQVGRVLPKPNYYLSFYGLIIIIHKLFFVSISFLNKFLVPFLASVLIPVSAYLSFKNVFADKKNLILSILFLLILSFSIFTLSTPQNFAYLLLLLTIILSVNYQTKKDLIIIFLLAFTALLAQPIAGIPALMFALIFTIYHSQIKFKKYFISALSIVTAPSLPFAFLFLEKTAGNEVQTGTNNLQNILSAFKISIPGQENFILNFVYLHAFNIKFIIGLICLAGLYLAWRQKEKYQNFIVYPIMSLSLFTSYLICKYLPFNFLIAYEVSDFVNRILIAAILFLIPFILLAIYTLLSKLENQNRFVRIYFLFFIAILITTSLYVSYPRFDRYFNSHGYSVGQNDIDAVRWINDNTKEDYIVLANQQVSAAALSRYGFSKYFKNNLFYYPIPTTSPLYQYYLDMVYKKPDKKTIEQAMDLAGVKTGYFVLNKYWWQFPKVLAEAKFNADSWQEFGNGEVYVFKYDRNFFTN